jgi:hypothetical protein
LTLLVSPGGPEPPQTKAALWFQSPIQLIAVTPIGQFSSTADGACPVEFDGGDVAYVKPRPDAAKNAAVAREKIAFDLAYLLELPVAPVVVRLPEPDAWPYHSAMSLAALPSARLWGAGGHDVVTAGERLEALRTFWTWIADDDHNGHPNNLLFAIRSGRCDVMAIDHAYSLCHRNPSEPLIDGVCQGYGAHVLPDAPAWCAAILDKIQSLDWAMVENVVHRLAPILPTADQDAILNILKVRRDRLAMFLGL